MLGSIYMKAYFPKLDSIRFYAFLLVLISHIYIFCYKASPETSQWFADNGPKIFAHGEIGVHIFFALSGFLIMLLAIREFKNKNSFSILGFFKRRILRIWPLYFLGLSLGLLIAGGVATDPVCINRFWYFLGNTCMTQGLSHSDLIALVGPLWSVSVEEQFYLTFPFLFAMGIFLIKKLGKKVGWLFVIVAVGAIVISFRQRYLLSGNWDYISYATVSVLPSLFLGMMLAIVLSVEKWVSRIASWSVRNKNILVWTAVLTIPLAMYLKFTGPLGISLYILVICISTSSMILLSLYSRDQTEIDGQSPTKIQKTTRYLGRISYGLYVYHMFAIVGVKYVFSAAGLDNGNLLVLYTQSIAILALTIILAHLSYTYIEKFFLRFK